MASQTFEVRLGQFNANEYICILTPQLQRSVEHTVELEIKLRDQQTNYLNWQNLVISHEKRWLIVYKAFVKPLVN